MVTIGNFWHANPDLYEEKDLRFHQKKAKKVDEYKNKWAAERGIPLIRIWEKDIRERPSEVLKMLKERLYIEDDKKRLLENKRKRH